VNDIAVQGAIPLFFLDYFSVGKLEAEIADQVVSGIARGCKNARCALIGGETAEMPGLYQPGEYDLAGFIVGGVERNEMLTGAKVKPGDLLIGLTSTGLHTNGYSLARKLLFEVAQRELTGDLADTLLKVHRSYLQPIQLLLKAGVLKAAAHITGGGITDNLPRVLPEGTAAQVDPSAWPVLPIFEELREIGNIPLDDYRRTFNLGIGMILVVSPKKLKKATRILDELGEKSYQIGHIIEAPQRQVVYV
jgi:phosphoribosylformylglycinamidine cyclo-ligase